MIYRLYGPIAATPSLHLALQHVARTPTARLSIVHRIVPRRPSPVLHEQMVQVDVRHRRPLRHAEVANLLAQRSIKTPLQLPLCLGAQIYLDNMLAGGVDGTALPLSIECRLQAYQQHAPAGMLADMVA